MPEISSFFGIVICMYMKDFGKHNSPHIHAFFGGDEAVFDIQTGEVLAGRLPRKAEKRVKKWISLRQNELMEDWNLAIKDRASGDDLHKIRGL